jgi:hypothetical protein
VIRLIGIVLLSAVSLPAAANLVDPRVEGDRVTATIELPGALSAELTVRFEKAVGLNLDSLGLSVQKVNPLDPALLGRLPHSTTLSIPAGFPVLVQIEPPAAGGLSFEGLVEVEIYTANLQYTAGSPLRLFSATSGGSFRDITDRNSGGSYRTRGSGGHFSDFLILVDTAPLPAAIDDKFVRLEQTLASHGGAMGAGLYTALDSEIAAARSAWLAGDTAAAIAATDRFRRTVRDASQVGELPSVWRSSRDVDNAAGELRADARTLRFSLSLAANLL